MVNILVKLKTVYSVTSLQWRMLSENAGSGIAFFRKLSMDLSSAALWGRHCGAFCPGGGFGGCWTSILLDGPVSDVSIDWLLGTAGVVSELVLAGTSVSMGMGSTEEPAGEPPPSPGGGPPPPLSGTLRGEAGPASRLITDSLRLGRITNGCSWLHRPTSCWRHDRSILHYRYLHHNT